MIARLCGVVAPFVIVLLTSACARRVEIPAPKPLAPLVGVDMRPRPNGPAAVLLGPRHSTTVYWLLGAMDEYAGRSRPRDDSDLIERFYCNEARTAAGFKQMVRRFAQEQGLTDDVTAQTVQECLAFYHSPAIASALDSMYPQRWPTGGFADGHEMTTLRSSPDMFHDAGPEDVMAYLRGAYFRYGRANAFVFSNAAHKADLVAHLLKGVGAWNVRRHTTDTIPNANRVHFEAAPALLRALETHEWER